MNSDQSEEENAAARQAAAEGRIKLLFVSPEHLDHVERFAAVARLPVALLVVDEAHTNGLYGLRGEGLVAALGLRSLFYRGPVAGGKG